MKKMYAMILAVILAMSMGMTSFAAGWQQDATGWWYATSDDGSTRYSNGWQWIDGNGDGISERYYFDENGYIYTSTVTPDGYTVNADGAWTIDDVVMPRTIVPKMELNVEVKDDGVYVNGVHHNPGYDPEHPLKNVIDRWNLRLDPETMNIETNVTSPQIQAMLTGQSEIIKPYEEYYAPIREEARITDAELYQWYCNWLNSWDFENATEMERAQKIQEVFNNIRYDKAIASADYGIGDYRTLIMRGAVCTDYAMTCGSLAKALHLKWSLGPHWALHTTYMLKIDGRVYWGENDGLGLEEPVDEAAIRNGEEYEGWAKSWLDERWTWQTG